MLNFQNYETISSPVTGTRPGGCETLFYSIQFIGESEVSSDEGSFDTCRLVDFCVLLVFSKYQQGVNFINVFCAFFLVQKSARKTLMTLTEGHWLMISIFVSNKDVLLTSICFDKEILPPNGKKYTFSMNINNPKMQIWPNKLIKLQLSNHDNTQLKIKLNLKTSY